MKLFDVNRRLRDAATRVQSVAYSLHHIHTKADEQTETYSWMTADEIRWLCAYEATDLFGKLISDLEVLVPLLNIEDDYPDVQGEVRRLADAVRARVLAAKLENVEGRTSEEAAAFQAKARQLRGESPYEKETA